MLSSYYYLYGDVSYSGRSFSQSSMKQNSAAIELLRLSSLITYQIINHSYYNITSSYPPYIIEMVFFCSIASSANYNNK